MVNTHSGFLAWIERSGNRLPHPASLFFIAACAVLLLSQLAEAAAWAVEKTVTNQAGEQVQVVVAAVGLLDSEGLWWVFSNMVPNFIGFPPLALVLVAMLGIGVAERSGLIAALMKKVVLCTPSRFLTPVVFFVAVMSSMAMDAGYVVLPPLAAALYLAVGRSPLVGIAVSFAGVSAGFSANLLLTALDPLLAGFTQAAAQLADERYVVSATANWWFMIASTLLLTLVGWWVTARYVEPRLSLTEWVVPDDINDAVGMREEDERRGLRWAFFALLVTLALLLLLVLIPDAPLHGTGKRFDRWIEAMVPIILVFFLVPGIAYGVGARRLRSDKDVAAIMGDTMSALGPYIVLAFFAAQFIAFFKQSNLGEMLAIVGGQYLMLLDMPSTLLIAGFVIVVMLGNLLLGSASAKYAFFAPVFVPMFMQVGISPELTQAAYRVGDSVTNVITPLNPYMVIVLAFMQRYMPQAGVGSLVAMMLPYALVFACVWLLLLMLWMGLGIPLGPQGPLSYHG